MARSLMQRPAAPLRVATRQDSIWPPILDRDAGDDSAERAEISGNVQAFIRRDVTVACRMSEYCLIAIDRYRAFVVRLPNYSVLTQSK